MKKILSTFALFALLLMSPVTHAADGDLSISSSSVWFSTSTYLEGHNIRLWASVQNNSGSDLLGSVHVTANGTQIGSDQPISALAGKSDDIFVDWTPNSYGNYTLVVTIEPWENAGDNSSNNVVTKTIYVAQDTDRDGKTNDVDDDDDGDGVLDGEDQYPLNGKESKDTDGDGMGDNEDTDDDNDGTLDLADDLPLDPNYTRDTDKDGTPDETDDDIDGDGVGNEDEVDYGTDPTLTDSDGDKVSDGEDPLPTDPTEWSDIDGDGTGDNADNDADGDGLSNETDPAPLNPAPSAEADQKLVIANIGETVTFDASSSSDDEGIVRYVWQFGDNTQDVQEGATVTRSFDSEGSQMATLTVFDQNGQSDSVQISIKILDYAFILKAMCLTLLLILLAFYLLYRYNRPRRGGSAVMQTSAKPEISPKKAAKKSSSKKRK